MKAREFDKRFDEGGDVTKYLDMILSILFEEFNFKFIDAAFKGVFIFFCKSKCGTAKCCNGSSTYFTSKTPT